MKELLDFILTELRGAWRYRWKAMIIVWVICIAGWAAISTMPDIYEARAQVYVDAQSRLAEVMTEVGVAPGVGSRVFVVRQAMLGRPQLESVARDTGIDLRATTDEEFDFLILKLRENITVSTGGRTREAQNLYVISFRDHDRKVAVAVVEELLNTFVKDVLELKERGTDDVAGYLDDQLNHYAGLLSNSELQLANFKKTHVGLLPGDSGGIFERLQAEMTLLNQLRRDLEIQEERREELRRQLQGETPYLKNDSENGVGFGLPGSQTEEKIAELELLRAQMLLKWTERHPDVIALDEQLALLRRQSDSERQQFIASGVGPMEGAANANNPVYQSSQIALNQSSVSIAGLRSQIQQQERLVTELRAQVDTIPKIEAEYAKLTRDYAQVKDLYDEVLLKKERERMGTVGEEMDVVTFNIIEPPAVSLEPVAPRRLIMMIGVLVFALGTGGAVSWVMHQNNPVFHDVQTLHEIARRPVLGAVSLTWQDRHRKSRRRGVYWFMLAGIALLAVFVAAMLFHEEFRMLISSR